jgi:hypothetical protein
MGVLALLDSIRFIFLHKQQESKKESSQSNARDRLKIARYKSTVEKGNDPSVVHIFKFLAV